MITGTSERSRKLRHTSVPGGPGEREIEQHQVRIGRLKRNRAVATRYDKVNIHLVRAG
jgi:hypothetical protein